MELGLAGKVALVTGSSRGIGRGIALALAQEGCDLVLTGTDAAALKEATAAVAAHGGDAKSVAIDLRKDTTPAALIDMVTSAYGRLDILVNNAGIGGAGRLEDTRVEDWNRVMDVNAKGVFLGTRAAIPALRGAGGGSIVNISSQLGLVGMDDSSPQYQASKGAVRIFTKSTAIQHAKDKIAKERIRANSVHPGPIITPMTAGRRADPAILARMTSRIPLGRYGEAEEVAYGVLYLASDESRFVTGSELVIDGGWTAQ